MFFQRVQIITSLALVALMLSARVEGADSTEKKHSGPGCLAVDDFFLDEVWTKVAERTCLKCHNKKGDASDSDFLLLNPAQLKVGERAKVHLLNRKAFTKMAMMRKDGKPRILLKVTRQIPHEGKRVLDPGSTGYRILEEFVRRVEGGVRGAENLQVSNKPFFDGITMVSDDRLLRRLTLSLAGRLPTQEERDAVKAGGLKAIGAILDRVMKEDAFYVRLKEGFNDIFLTWGYDGNGEEVLSYDHFNKTRHWYKKWDFGHLPEKERQRAGWKLAGVYRDTLRHEPMELIAYIVRNDRPFSEIVTADYIMVSPYSSRGYGVFEMVKDKFKNVEDPFEYVPVSLPALVARNGKKQPSKTGDYPHAGFLSMFHYLRRYPSTETNRNRLRARMYYQHFLGVDVMRLASRVSDAAGVLKEYEIPTMQAADCVVCHKTIDPVAGLFQDWFNEGGYYGPRKEGWFIDIFGPGLEGDDLPPEEKWRALQWLGEKTAKDPRFAVAMVEHVYYIMMGRKVMLAPQDIDDPMFTPKRRAYERQRKEIEDIAARFAKAGFNLKVVFKALAVSPFYRADGLASAIDNEARRAELNDVGLVRMLSPEQLNRKLDAVFGQDWQPFKDKFTILYGGIDSKEVTARMTEPSGAMGAIQRIMANEIACKTVPLDFSMPADKRRLFPNIEVDVTPEEGEQAIRKAMVHLHDRLLGRVQKTNDPAVDRTYHLFVNVINDAKARQHEKLESYFCRGVDKKRMEDPHYTMRAWRAVVTYLMRQQDFLYE